MFDFNAEQFIPFLIFSIPIIAIVGGITAGIVRTIGNQRLVELAQRERILALERGVDISKLPPLPAVSTGDDDPLISFEERSRRRGQGLLIGGLVLVAAGISLCIFLNLVSDDSGVWAVGLIPASVGVALLVSAMLVAPKGGERGGASRMP